MALEDGMTVLNNPLFQAVGDHLGLGGVFAQAKAAAAPPPGRSAPNIPEYRNRPYIPRPEMGGGHGGVAPGGTNPTTPGTMDPATLQDPNVQKILNMYGVHPSTEAPDPNLFVHNPAAFQRHPVLAGLLERGMEGLAFAHPGDDALSSLIGGVRGIQEAQAARANQVNAQVMAPITQAEAIQKLMGTAETQADSHAKSQAEIARDQAMGRYYDSNGQTKAERLMLMGRPETTGPNKGRMWYPQDDGNGGLKWAPDPNFVQDPVERLRSIVSDSMIKDLDKQYPNGIPADVAQKALSKLQSQDSIDKEAGKNMGREITGRWSLRWHQATAAARGMVPHMAPGDQKAWQDLDQQAQSLSRYKDSALNFNTTFTNPENGQVVASPEDRQAYAARLSSQIDGIRTRMQSIERAYGTSVQGPATPAAPTYSPGNPFAKKK